MSVWPPPTEHQPAATVLRSSNHGAGGPRPTRFYVIGFAIAARPRLHDPLPWLTPSTPHAAEGAPTSAGSIPSATPGRGLAGLYLCAPPFVASDVEIVSRLPVGSGRACDRGPGIVRSWFGDPAFEPRLAKSDLKWRGDPGEHPPQLPSAPGRKRSLRAGRPRRSPTGCDASRWMIRDGAAPQGGFHGLGGGDPDRCRHRADLIRANSPGCLAGAARSR
jgi:hypothetical protein